MKYVGVTISGKSVELGNPITVRINKSADAPADNLYAVFYYESIVEELKYIRAYLGEDCIFNGILDEQIVELSKSGALLKIYARSKAALLVDNEAMPQTYISTSLETVFNRHIRPYGFSAFVGSDKKFSDKFIVYKGMSEWEVLESFCEQFLNTKPRVRGDGTIDTTGSYSGGRNINLNNYSNGIKYKNISRNIKRYNKISEVFVKDGRDSLYTVKVVDDDNVRDGIKRKRYIDASKDVRDPNICAQNAIDSANKESCEVVAECIGAVSADVGDRVTINDVIFGKIYDLPISKIKYVMDSNGETTELTMFEGK